MAISLRVSARPGAPTGAGKLSAGYGGKLSLTVSGIDDLEAAYVVVGASGAGVPATYAGFRVIRGNLVAAHRGALQVTYDEGAGTYAVVLTVQLGSDDVMEDDHVYVGVFTVAGGPPDATDVPDAVAGPYDGIR